MGLRESALYNQIKWRVKRIYLNKQYANSQKIFCIGKNKTGTTSLEALFRSQQYAVGDQAIGESLVADWVAGRYDRIVKFARYGGTFFQDVPFSLPDTYKMLDEQFPDARFILTVRDSAEQWYRSLTRFHSKVFGNGSLPTRADLEASTYHRPGYAWMVFRALHNTPENDLYNKEHLIGEYERYNAEVVAYFKDDPSRLLQVNLSDESASEAISSFLSWPEKVAIPWENKT